ncbi:hypothetical protein [Nonomuraea angiospora]|nr:hypothetical protein [Nonomuraea angiospora]MDX3110044.1 hypothetical protein [Nonomuraea angiospora]
MMATGHEQVAEAIAAMDPAAARAAALVRASRVEVLGSAPAWER